MALQSLPRHLAAWRLADMVSHRLLRPGKPGVDQLPTFRSSDEDLRSLGDGTPVVMLNRRVGQMPSVVFDNIDAAKQAVTHLVALGHRRIAYIAGPGASWVNRERQCGLRAATGAAGVELVEIGNVSPTLDGGGVAADPLLASAVTAAVAYNDLVALGVLRRLRTHGVDVPGDISLVGFDDIPTSDFVDPALTTVAGAKTQLGRAGIDLLMTLFQDRPQRGAARRILPTQLIVRASTAIAPRGAAARSRRRRC